MEFSRLNNDIQIRHCTIPQHVSVTKNPNDETTEQVIARQDKFITLPDPIREKLSSSETGIKIQRIGGEYNLNLLQLADIARAVRSYYFGEVQLENFPLILSKEIGITQATAKEISDIVIQKIINDRSQQIAYEAQFARLTISDALKKFPDLGEQPVTSSRINIKSFPDPVRPSIKNWLFDYTFNMGHDSHDAMARGNYLFQNPNAKALLATDRQKLEYLLKAYDENTLVTVNVNTKQIMFPQNVERKTGSAIRDTRYEIHDTRYANEPEDIFQKTQENERKYFSGTVVQNRQWINLPKETPSAKPAPAPNPAPKPIPKPYESNYKFTPATPTAAAPQIKKPAPVQTLPSAKMEFSSPHKMPVEKQTPAAPKPQSIPLPSNSQSAPQLPRPLQPIRIVPSGMRGSFSEETSNSTSPSKNIVNLKE
ncbi:MAG: hypothetical protein P4L62_00325 [Candidatus Pacebacteria bacterium]|nr:hypothetical protein [Candidatus Paceibacterota bacterium]